QALGFATGGYLAGRLRSPAFDGVPGERTFRDAAQGFMVGAIGVVAMLTVAGFVGLHAVGATAQVASGLLSGATGNAPGQPTAASSTGSMASTKAAPAFEYFVDAMFRPAPAGSVAREGE